MMMSSSPVPTLFTEHLVKSLVSYFFYSTLIIITLDNSLADTIGLWTMVTQERDAMSEVMMR